MGTNNINRTENSPTPLWGIRPGFNISDLDSCAGYKSIVVFTNITAATTSAVFKDARFISIDPVFTDPTTFCDIDLYTWNGSVATKVYTFAGANSKTMAIFMGGFEGVDLQGGQFKIGVSNVINPNTANFSISYRVNG